MKTKLLLVASIFALLLTQPSVLLSQSAEAHEQWRAVQVVQAGAKLRIETKSGERVDGTLSSLSESAVTLISKGQPTSFDRTDIRKIYRLENGSRAKSTLIGAGIGAGMGVGAGAAALGATGGSDRTPQVIGVFTIAGAGIGAAVGAALGKGQKRILIYESK